MPTLDGRQVTEVFRNPTDTTAKVTDPNRYPHRSILLDAFTIDYFKILIRLGRLCYVLNRYPHRVWTSTGILEA